MFVVQAWFFIASLMITSMMRKDPTAGKTPTLADFNIPTAEDGKIIPVLFGTREISAYNVVWHGDLVVERFKQREPSYRRPQAHYSHIRYNQSVREAALGL